MFPRLFGSAFLEVNHIISAIFNLPPPNEDFDAFSSVPYNKILNLSKFKPFADDKF